MEFRKKIDIPKSELRISHQTKMVLLGSCFAENMGSLFTGNKFPVSVNPFGVLYNPDSIQQAVNILLDERSFNEHDVFRHEGLYHTFYHHSQFSDINKDAFLRKINEERVQASAILKQADILLVTFGTSYVFKHIETGQIVANCHKLSASVFEHYRLNIEDVIVVWDGLIARLREVNPSVKILFTVSPIRHWKDGAHNNQLSKAVLLLAIDELMKKHCGVFYFPSYEIVLDELRDYRFYSEDMIHPSETAIRYIQEVFAETYFDEETIEINKKWQNILKAINHRPFNFATDEHKQFLRQTLLKIKELRNKYTYFDCEKEELSLTERLSSI